nr:hotdog fold thioesterase [Melghirimyces profundicolus]
MSMSQTEFSFDNTVLNELGIRAVQLKRDSVVLKMPVDSRHHQPYGILHGGVSVVLAETAASLGAWLNCDHEKEHTVGLEINANHIRSKREGTVTAVAEPLHIGRSTMVWEIKIKDEEDKLICVSRCTMAVVPNRKED